MRLTPYMKRRTADEYRRRRQEVLNALWAPLGFALLMFFLMGGGDDNV